MSLKYNVEVEIDKPIKEVLALFEDRSNNQKWMVGLKDQQILEGEANEQGCVTKLTFDMEGHNFEMTEKILTKKLPSDYTVFYSADGSDNTVKCVFEDLDGDRTRYTTVNEFFFKDKQMEAMADENPDAFSQQSLVYLNNFKSFVESQ